MTIDIIQKLSNLSLLTYFDKSFNMLCVHFFGKDDKPDLMAYLMSNYSWDLREVLSEKAELFDDCESIKITQKRLGVFEANSKFDLFVRNSLFEILNNENLKEDKDVKEILKNGYK